jgi:hypothetical protein
MSERKPDGVSWESWIDQQIREATERGEFDDLPGRGKPVPGLDGPHDELWWVKDKLRRERISFLPPALAVKKEVEDALDRVEDAASESEVRQIVADLNARIVEVNSRTVQGPSTSVAPLDVEMVLRRWRARRSDQDED